MQATEEKIDRKTAMATAFEMATKKLAEHIRAGGSQALREVLKTMALFHSYSFNNIMMIWSQYPDATNVAGFRKWNRFNRYVRKGEKGIRIFVPMIFNRDDSNEEDKKRPRVMFRIGHVFDVKQTDGEPLPRMNEKQGDPGEALPRLYKLVDELEIKFEKVESLANAKGIARPDDKQIKLRNNLSITDEFTVLVHEVAHVLLHRREERPEVKICELEAEAVSAVVAEAVGLSVQEQSADYILLYKNNESDLIASLSRIRNTSNVILDAILDAEPTTAGTEKPEDASELAA